MSNDTIGVVVNVALLYRRYQRVRPAAGDPPAGDRASLHLFGLFWLAGWGFVGSLMSDFLGVFCPSPSCLPRCACWRSWASSSPCRLTAPGWLASLRPRWCRRRSPAPECSPAGSGCPDTRRSSCVDPGASWGL